MNRLPSVYHDLSEAFSKTKASRIPPHRTNDCAIDLVPGTTPAKGRVFPLSQPETEAMRKYIEEELAKGFIRPSTSPASAGFFFVQKTAVSDPVSIIELSMTAQSSSAIRCP